MAPILAELVDPGFPWAAVAVALPLAAALLSALLARAAALIGPWLALLQLAIALLVTMQVHAHGVVEIVIGGWPPPLGIALRADGLSAAFLLTTAVVALGAVLFARSEFAPDASGAETRAGYAFWPLVFFLAAGLNATFVSGDLFNLYVALELLTVAAVALVSLGGKGEGVAAAFRYLLFALLGSLAFLLGAAILYAAYGTLDIRLLGTVIRANAATVVAAGLMTAGLMAKIALFPLHAWLPAAHSAAPAAASALLSALVVKAGFVILLRLWFEAMPVVATGPALQILALFGAGGVLLGSVMAMRQERLKLVVAYSTVAQLGYLFLVFPLAGGSGDQQPWTAGAWSGAVFHALSHALAKAAMFLSAGTMAVAVGHDRLDGIVGLGRDLPIASFAFGLAAVSLMGLPPSGGFTGKYLLLTSAFASGQWWWGAVMLVGGLLAAIYLFRPLNRLLAAPAAERALVAVPRGRQAIALTIAVLSILLGVLSAGPYALLQIGRAAAAVEGLE